MKNNPEIKFQKKRDAIFVFVISFLIFGVLFTSQMLILRNIVDYEKIRISYVIAIICFWMVAAIAFTVVTLYQINRRYQKPMEQFADAARKVANGDFSVYLPAWNRPDRTDFLDIIFKDFNKMVEELGSIETLKTEFFSNVSHEIKTPLAVIQNYAEMMRHNDITDEQAKEYTNIILNTSKRLSELITNILKLNKLEKQSIHPVSESYDLCRQLCDTAVLFEDVWESKNIDFIADTEDFAQINADPSLLEIVWSNLLSNAIKFTGQGGSVTLTQRTDDNGEITVSVSDTGCGMSEEMTRRIFDKFYQGDTAHTSEGNGLGLAIVKRIIELSDAVIRVDSKEGKGSTFTVCFPAVKEADNE